MAHQLVVDDHADVVQLVAALPHMAGHSVLKDRGVLIGESFDLDHRDHPVPGMTRPEIAHAGWAARRETRLLLVQGP